MSITPTFGWRTDPNNPNAVISSASLSQTPQIKLPTKTTLPPVNITGAQATIDSVTNSLAEIQKQTDELRKQELANQQIPPPAPAETGFMSSVRDGLGIPKPESTADIYQQTYGVSPEQARSQQLTAQNDFNTKQSAVKVALSKFQGINARLAGVVAEAKAIPIQVEETAVASGRIATTAGLNADKERLLRQNALKAIPIQSEALVAQAEVASAQGDAELSQSLLQQAQGRLDDFFKAKIEDSRNNYDYKTKVYSEISKYLDKKEERILDEKKSELTTNNSLYSNFINDVRTAATSATSNSQGSLSGQFSSLVSTLDPTSKDFFTKYTEAQKQFAVLQGGISVQQKTPSTNNPNNPGSNPPSSLSQAVIDNPSLFYNFTPTQKAVIISELQRAGYDIADLQNSKLSSGQQDDIAQMSTVNTLIGDILSYNNDGKLEGLGAFGIGSLKAIASQAGLGSKEGQAVRALIGNIKGTIAKLRGGTSFTVNEEKLLNTYTPSVNDSPGVAVNKLHLLQDFISKKNADLLKNARLNITKGQITKPNNSGGIENLRTKYNY